MTSNPVERRLRAAFTASSEIVPPPESIADTLSASSQAFAADPSSASTPSRRWRAPILAAAGVAAVVVATFVATNAASHRGSVPPAASPRPAASSGPAAPSSPPRTAAGGGSIDHPVIGVAYPFRLATHCGITFALFGGRTWQAVGTPAVPVSKPNPDGTMSYTGYTPGSMTLLSTDQLRFTVDETAVTGPTKTVMFHPTSTQPRLCA